MKLLFTAVAAVGLVALPALAQQKSPPADPAKAAPIAGTVCAGCHGPDGNSPLPANPILAGQHAQYISKQLANFAARDGKEPERKNPIMNAMVAALSPEDMRNLGAYFSDQKPKAGEAKSKEAAQRGEKLYRGGNAAMGVPACAGCHGPNGAGIPAQYPRLAGQYADYTVAQLKAFRAEERQNDPQKMMRMIAAKMSDKDIADVAEYLAGLR